MYVLSQHCCICMYIMYTLSHLCVHLSVMTFTPVCTLFHDSVTPVYVYTLSQQCHICACVHSAMTLSYLYVHSVMTLSHLSVYVVTRHIHVLWHLQHKSRNEEPEFYASLPLRNHPSAQVWYSVCNHQAFDLMLPITFDLVDHLSSTKLTIQESEEFSKLKFFF